MAENVKITWLKDQSGEKISPMTTASQVMTYDSSGDLKTKLEIIDDNISTLNENIREKQATITGTAGQFVVIGDDGNVTTKTVPYAEEATFGV